MRATQGRLTTLDKLWPYPELILHRAGMTPDRWQAEVLRTRKTQILLLCSRMGIQFLCGLPVLVLADRQRICQ
jgi:hypothetical protein